MAIPNYQAEVAAAAERYPTEWRAAHRDGPNTEAFIRLLARDLHAIDPRCGLNGKRGNPNDISDDVIAIRGEGSAVDVVNGGPMEIIDVIVGAGGPNPQPAWNVAPGGAGDRGTWVKPEGVPTPVPTPTPVPVPQTCQFQPKDDTIVLQSILTYQNEVRELAGMLYRRLDAVQAIAERAEIAALNAADQPNLQAQIADVRDALRNLALQGKVNLSNRILGSVSGTFEGTGSV